MKKAVLLLTLVALPLFSFAQNEVEQHYLYNIVTIKGGLNKKGFNAKMDNGVTIGKLKDEDGKKLKFRTPAAALLYLGSQGWELCQEGATSMSTNGKYKNTDLYWIIRKPCTKEELDLAVEAGLKR